MLDSVRQLEFEIRIPLAEHDIIVVSDISLGIVFLVMRPGNRDDDLLHIIEFLFCQRCRPSAGDGDIAVIIKLSHLLLADEAIGMHIRESVELCQHLLVG